MTLLGSPVPYHIYIYIAAKDPKQQGLMGSGTGDPSGVTCPLSGGLLSGGLLSGGLLSGGT